MRIVYFMICMILMQVGTYPLKAEEVKWSIVYHFIEDESLPNVLVVGDSITHQYAPYVKKYLMKKANLSYLATSACCVESSFTDELSLVLKNREYDVIQFNNGHHCTNYFEYEYSEGIIGSIRLLLKHNKDVKLIWANTTPRKGDSDDIYARNQEISQALNEMNISTNDLYSPLLKHKELYNDSLHLNATGSDILGRQVADRILDVLK